MRPLPITTLLLAQARDALQSTGDHPDLVARLNVELAETFVPGEGHIHKCPECNDPWWTVQLRCGCWPKPGTLEADNQQLRTALEFYAGKPYKIALANLFKKGTMPRPTHG